jgi:hypothetical protein
VGDTNLGHFTLGSRHEVLYLGLDDAADTLSKVPPAYAEGRDGFSQKGRYSLQQLRGQN